MILIIYVSILISSLLSTYNLPPSSSCYRPSLSTQMRDMGHEEEEDDDDNNNNNDDDDDDNGGDHVLQQQHTITYNYT